MLKPPEYLHREHEIIPIDDEEAETLLTDARKMIDDQTVEKSFGLNRARWICATLSHMPVPLAWYEETARNLGRSTIRRLADQMAFRHDDGMGAAMQALKMQFDLIVRHLEQHNPRANALKLILPAAAKRGPVLILVRDRIFQRALQTWLDLQAFPNQPWLRQVEICACPDFAPIALKNYPTVIINGVLPRRYRWIAGAALGTDVKFLAYYTESEPITAQLNQIYGRKTIESNARQRDFGLLGTPVSTSSAVAVSPKMPELELKAPKPKNKQKKDAKATQFTAKITDFRNLAGALASAEEAARRAVEKETVAEKKSAAWEDVADEEPYQQDRIDLLSEQPHADDIQCVRFAIHSKKRGNGFIYLPPDQTVECIRQTFPDEVSQSAASELKQGDILILVEQDVRGNLFDRVV
ncbi:MAG: hypothetical protein ACXWKH_11680, partial [Limisphaerales bacterium]